MAKKKPEVAVWTGLREALNCRSQLTQVVFTLRNKRCYFSKITYTTLAAVYYNKKHSVYVNKTKFL